MIKRILFLGVGVFFIGGCSSTPSVIPDKDEVKVSRKKPDDSCTEIGKFIGQSPKDDKEEALEDLKSEAANKGADYVQVLEYSAYGGKVTGMAFKCYN